MKKAIKIPVITLLLLLLFVQGKRLPVNLPNNAFKGGEKLDYVLHYGFIVGGVATLSVIEKEINGKKIYYAKTTAKSVGMCDRIFKVKDIYESFFDAETGLPYKAKRHVKESSYEDYNELKFNHSSGTVESKKSGVKQIPDNCFDIVSAFYYIRRYDFKDIQPGDIIKMNAYFEDKNYPFEIRYRGREVIKCKVGKVQCLKFNPVVEPGRIFDTEDDLKIWITDDKNHIPVRVQFDFIVGSVKCDLVEYSGLKNNFAKL